MTSENNTLTATEQANREAALAIATADKPVDALDTGAALAAIKAAKTLPTANLAAVTIPGVNAPAKGETKPATVPGDKPVEAKPTATPPQAEKPTGDAAKPAIKPVTAQGGSSGGKAKGKPKSKREAAPEPKPGQKPTAYDNPWFDLSRWPSWANAAKPERWALFAAATPLGAGQKPVFGAGTSNHLAVASYFQMADKPSFNYFDIGECIGTVRFRQADHKSNCANAWLAKGFAFIAKASIPYKNPERTGNPRPAMAYGMTLYQTDSSGKVTANVKADVIRKIEAYLLENGCKPPAHLFGPLVKPTADQPKALPSK